MSNSNLAHALGNLTNTAHGISDQITEYGEATLLFFMLIGAQIVLFMQAGFAMLEVGLVGHKNAKSILFKNMLDMCVGAICWWCFGFGVAGAGASGQSGREFGVASNGSLDMKNSICFIHSLSFAATTCTIMSGGVAERMRLEMYIACAVMLISLVYPTVIGWGWDSGQWLCGGGFVDFAGSCLVHLTGGVCALLGALLVGPRRHRFGADGTVMRFKENSVLLAVLGCLILTFCWISFNASSTLAADYESMSLSVHATVNTVLAMASATLTTVIFDYVFNDGVNDVFETCNGLLGGLVAVTAGCAFMSNWAAIVVGVLSAILTKKSSELLISMKIDDPLDAWTVHGANGILATLYVGFASRPDLIELHYAKSYHPKGHYGLFYSGSSGSLILIQLQGVLAVGAFVSVVMLSWMLLIASLSALYRSAAGVKTDAADPFRIVRSNLRMNADEEVVGADYVHHGGSAFELTKAQIKLHNEMRGAQDKMERRKKAKSERKSSVKPSGDTNGSALPKHSPKQQDSKPQGMQTNAAFTVPVRKTSPGTTPTETPSPGRSRENSGESSLGSGGTLSSGGGGLNDPDEDVYEVN